MKDNNGGQPRGKKVPGENEISIELEAGIVQDEVDSSFALTLAGLSLLQGIERIGNAVDQDSAFSFFAKF